MPPLISKFLVTRGDLLHIARNATPHPTAARPPTHATQATGGLTIAGNSPATLAPRRMNPFALAQGAQGGSVPSPEGNTAQRFTPLPSDRPNPFQKAQIADARVAQRLETALQHIERAQRHTAELGPEDAIRNAKQALSEGRLGSPKQSSLLRSFASGPATRPLSDASKEKRESRIVDEDAPTLSIKNPAEK